MSTHTQEPWRVENNAESDVSFEVMAGDGWYVATTHDGVESKSNAYENARRIVACVNACSGIPTETLEYVSAGEYHDARMAVLKERDEYREQRDAAERERDELRGRLEAAEQDAGRYLWLRNPEIDVALVIDKVTGELESGHKIYEYRAGDELDAAIDAAIAKAEGRS